MAFASVPILNSESSAPPTKKEITISYSHGTYKGEYKEVNGKVIPDGQGSLLMESDTYRSYSGPFVNGLFHGEGGILTFANGDKFEGKLKFNKRSGLGRMYYKASGRTYEGEWLNDKQHGRGFVYDASRTIVAGPRWFNSKLHGNAYLCTKEGHRLEGVFRHGVVEGQVTIVYRNGSVYTGFVNPHDYTKCGEGRMEYFKGGLHEASGHYKGRFDGRYEGQFSQDQKSGFGTYWSEDGRRYQGSFRNDRFHGFGTTYDSSGKIEECGRFDEGVFIEREDYFQVEHKHKTMIIRRIDFDVTVDGVTFPGPHFEGEVRDGKKNTIARGQWIDQKLHGNDCEVTYVFHGVRILGPYRNGWPHGMQEMHYPGDRTIIVKFTHGNREMQGKLTLPDGRTFIGGLSGAMPNSIGSIDMMYKQHDILIAKGMWINGLFQPRRKALVIGIAKYIDLLQLSCPENDARDIQKVLQSLGFQVTLLHNPPYRELPTAVFQFIDELNEGDICFIYVSSHGLRSFHGDFILPIDYKPKGILDDGAGLPFHDIEQALIPKRPRLAVAVLDLCRVAGSRDSKASTSSQHARLESEVTTCVKDSPEHSRLESLLRDDDENQLPVAADVFHHDVVGNEASNPATSVPSGSTPKLDHAWNNRSRGSSRDISKSDLPAGCQLLVAYASENDTMAYESAFHRNSWFTSALLPHLSERIPVVKVFERTVDDMKKRFKGDQVAEICSSSVSEDATLFVSPPKAKWFGCFD